MNKCSCDYCRTYNPNAFKNYLCDEEGCCPGLAKTKEEKEILYLKKCQIENQKEKNLNKEIEYLNKEIEYLNKEIEKLKSDQKEGTKDYLALRDLADKYIVEKESWKQRYLDLKFSYMSLIHQAKSFINLVEKKS